MEINPLVSIIVINYNGRKYLKNCFDSLLAGTYKNLELIMVDNGSSDGSIDFIRKNYKNIAALELKNNLGLAIASNKGANVAKGKYLFFFNNDTVADPDLIQNLVSAMENDPKIGIAGCSTYTYDGKSLINAGVPCDIFGYPYGKTEPFYVDAGIFITNVLFNIIGRFDEKMFLYGEDRDLCWRTWLYGYKVSVASNAKFFHDSFCISSDIKEYRTNINKRFLGEFNFLRSILKNYSLESLFFILPLYASINLAEIIAFLFRGEASVIKNVYLRAYLENFKDFKNLLILRRKLQNERKISDFEIMEKMDKIPGKLRLLLSIGLPKFGKMNKYGSCHGFRCESFRAPANQTKS